MWDFEQEQFFRYYAQSFDFIKEFYIFTSENKRRIQILELSIMTHEIYATCFIIYDL